MFSAVLSWFDRKPAPVDEPLPVPELAGWLAEIARPDDEPAMDAPSPPAALPADEDRRLFDEAGDPVRIPGDERPAGAREDCGHWAVEVARAEVGDADAHLAEYLTALAQLDLPAPAANARTGSVEVTVDNTTAVFTPAEPLPRSAAEVLTEIRERDPGEAKRGPDWPEPPDYGRPLTATGQLLTRIDEEIAGSLAARLQRIAEDRYAQAERGRLTALYSLRLARGDLAGERALRQDAQARLVAVEGERDSALSRVAELELTLRALGRETDAHDAKGGGGDG